MKGQALATASFNVERLEKMKEALEMELECIVHMLDKARIELKKQQNISKFGGDK